VWILLQTRYNCKPFCSPYKRNYHTLVNCMLHINGGKYSRIFHQERIFSVSMCLWSCNTCIYEYMYHILVSEKRFKLRYSLAVWMCLWKKLLTHFIIDLWTSKDGHLVFYCFHTACGSWRLSFFQLKLSAIYYVMELQRSATK